jgi:hypothetical protein
MDIVDAVYECLFLFHALFRQYAAEVMQRATLNYPDRPFALFQYPGDLRIAEAIDKPHQDYRPFFPLEFLNRRAKPVPVEVGFGHGFRAAFQVGGAFNIFQGQVLPPGPVMVDDKVPCDLYKPRVKGRALYLVPVDSLPGPDEYLAGDIFRVGLIADAIKDIPVNLVNVSFVQYGKGVPVATDCPQDQLILVLMERFFQR